MVQQTAIAEQTMATQSPSHTTAATRLRATAVALIAGVGAALAIGVLGAVYL